RHLGACTTRAAKSVGNGHRLAAARARAHTGREVGRTCIGRVVDRLFEVAHAVADSLAELRQLARAKDDQNDDQDDDKMPRLHYAHIVFSREATIPCVPWVDKALRW